MRLLDTNKIDRRHLMQWKLIGGALHQVSLPEHPHPTIGSSNADVCFLRHII